LIGWEKNHLMLSMAERIINEARETALIGLLDDPSPVVREALSAEFARMGTDGVALLKKALQDTSGEGREHASQLLETLALPDPTELLINFIKGLQYDLETGFFLINKVISPELEIADLRNKLDALAARCREIGMKPSSERDQCMVINRVLFHENGFRGDREDYENPLNSCLDAVFRRRKGIPISLSAIYILIGQRLGLDLEPIGLPGHFMVACFHGEKPFYIDPFAGGRIRELSEVREFLESEHISPELHHVVPAPVGEVLCRACRNLVAQFEHNDEPHWANRFRRFVREFEKTYRRESQA
jgi:regulator of sirC expression with transglutaminase-like and TPR domain